MEVKLDIIGSMGYNELQRLEVKRKASRESAIVANRSMI